MNNEKTENLINELRESNSVYHYISKYDTEFPKISFRKYVDMIIQKKNLKKSKIIKDAGLHRTYAYQIFSGKKKPSRDKVIMLSYGLDLTLKESQKLLKIAEFSPLTPKNKRDSIILYAKCNGLNMNKTLSLLYENGEEILQ